MAMTIGDANDVQTLLAWLLGDPTLDPDLLGDYARDAAIRLGDRSNAVLGAGRSGSTVATGWPLPGLPIGARHPAHREVPS